MLFNSFSFFIFFPIVTGLYFLLPSRFRWALLLIASCVFYMAFIPKYILILGVTITVDYIAGIMIERSEGTRRKKYLIISIISNIGFLAFFKYYNFATDNLNTLFLWLNLAYAIPLLHIILPIGLSFHTFQAMSYTIEVYRGNQRAERHPGIFALYVLFFPQLVAGPIERPQNLLPQFREQHVFDWNRVKAGLSRMLWGLFKKMVIADNCAVIVNRVFDFPTQFEGWPLIIAAVLFSVQIYCDFSGYSDIALGAAKVLGFNLMENFNRPYIAKSISEFWKRWHISLSSWFRDYVYIPLGGNRVSEWRLNFNFLIVFLLSGLWHGANWTFVVWGGLHGLFLIMSRLTEKTRNFFARILRLRKIPALHGAIRTLYIFLLVCFAFIFFRAHTVSEAWYIVSHLFVSAGEVISSPNAILTWTQFVATVNLTWLKAGNIILAIVTLAAVEYIRQRPSALNFFMRQPVWLRWFAYDMLGMWIFMFGYFGERAFIYFQF